MSLKPFIHGAVKAVAVLERVGFSEEEEARKAETVPPEGTSLAAVVALAYRSGSARALGLPTTVEEFTALLATEGEGEGVAPDFKESCSSRKPDASVAPQ
jgi:hypothetical protein